MPRIYTRTGDDGSTGLLYGGRVLKCDPVTEAYGTTDEAVAALGLARAWNQDPSTDEELLAYWSWARELERTPDNAAPNVHRKMRLAAERELRKRRIPQPED